MKKGCCNQDCDQGDNCPLRATPLICANGGRQVDTTTDDPWESDPWDWLDRAIWSLFKFCVAGFVVLVVVQLSRWIHG